MYGNNSYHLMECKKSKKYSMDLAFENPDMNVERVPSKLTGDSRSRIQKKQERELAMLKQFKQQTQTYKAIRASEQNLNRAISHKAVTAPVTPLKTAGIMWSPVKPLSREVSKRDGDVTYDIESLQSRLHELQINKCPRADSSTQTNRGDYMPRVYSTARIESPQPGRRRQPVGWSGIFDSVVRELNSVH